MGHQRVDDAAASSGGLEMVGNAGIEHLGYRRDAWRPIECAERQPTARAEARPIAPADGYGSDVLLVELLDVVVTFSTAAIASAARSARISEPAAFGWRKSKK